MLANTLKVSLSTIDRKLNEFPHIKLGDTRQSRVLFEADEVDVLPSSNTYKKLNDNSILTNCVAHDDNNPSMCLTQKRDRVYFHCFSGCDQRDVAKAFAQLLRGAR